VNSHYTKPLPRPTPVSREFWEGARRHELRLQRCSGCGEHVFYPRVLCPNCLADGLEWVTASGRGKVHSYTVVRRAMHPSFRPDVPYVYAVVALEEGPHMPTNIVGCSPEDVSIDMPVEVEFDDVTEERTLVKFKPQPTLSPEGAEAGESPAEERGEEEGDRKE
jgi:uncharacterized OB-fold protein